MNNPELQEDVWLQVASALIAVVLTASIGWLLLRAPAIEPAAPALEVVLIERVAASPTSPVPRPAPAGIASPSRSGLQAAPVDPRPRPIDPPASSSPSLATPPTAARVAKSQPAPAGKPATPRLVYSQDGRIALPPGVAIDPMQAAPGEPPGGDNDRAAQAARKVLEKPNPVGYVEPGFNSSQSDGTLGELAAKKIAKVLDKLSGKIPLREEIQSARPRPPPPVAFNPALHERRSDLGSEATGDAYKAAPIAFKPAPGLKGEASTRIREAIGDVERAGAGCERKALQALLAPARSNLADLERTEYAAAHGADPVQLDHMLPRAADMAYDQARRAIWYAQQQLPKCAK